MDSNWVISTQTSLVVPNCKDPACVFGHTCTCHSHREMGAVLAGLCFSVFKKSGYRTISCLYKSAQTKIHSEEGWSVKNKWYGASVGGSLCDTSKTYVWQVRLTSHESKPHKKHNSPNKHHHHGGGAANPSSGVDLINPHHPRGGRPCTCLLRCHPWSDVIDSMN